MNETSGLKNVFSLVFFSKKTLHEVAVNTSLGVFNRPIYAIGNPY